MTIATRIAASGALIVTGFLLGLGGYHALEPALGSSLSASLGILIPVLCAFFAYLRWGFGTSMARSLYLVGAAGLGGVLVLIYKHMSAAAN